jgi:hypothetical protein
MELSVCVHPTVASPLGGLQVRCWNDVFPAAHPYDDRLPLTAPAPNAHGTVGSISFGSTHCSSTSNREDWIRGLQQAGVPVTVVGGNCLANAPETLQAAGRDVRGAAGRGCMGNCMMMPASQGVRAPTACR